MDLPNLASMEARKEKVKNLLDEVGDQIPAANKLEELGESMALAAPDTEIDRWADATRIMLRYATQD
jgi:hypothetical protein